MKGKSCSNIIILFLLRFVQEYEKYIPIWGMTPQNEPLTGFEENFPWNTCAWSAEDMRDWIKTSFGPAMTDAGLRRVQIMVLDHNRDALPWYPETVRCGLFCFFYVFKFESLDY